MTVTLDTKISNETYATFPVAYRESFSHFAESGIYYQDVKLAKAIREASPELQPLMAIHALTRSNLYGSNPEDPKTLGAAVAEVIPDIYRKAMFQQHADALIRYGTVNIDVPRIQRFLREDSGLAATIPGIIESTKKSLADWFGQKELTPQQNENVTMLLQLGGRAALAASSAPKTEPK